MRNLIPADQTLDLAAPIYGGERYVSTGAGPMRKATFTRFEATSRVYYRSTDTAGVSRVWRVWSIDVDNATGEWNVHLRQVLKNNIAQDTKTDYFMWISLAHLTRPEDKAFAATIHRAIGRIPAQFGGADEQTETQPATDAVVEAQIANDNAADDMPQTPAELVASINREVPSVEAVDAAVKDGTWATPAGPALPGVIWAVGTSRSITVEDVEPADVLAADRITQINEVPIGIQDVSNGDVGVLVEHLVAELGEDGDPIIMATVWMGPRMIELVLNEDDVIQVVRR